jgi:ribosome-associated heat shock protein Hsp15
MAGHERAGKAEMTETVRIDKWLWASRFYKTRGKAREAIVGGKIQLNGNRVKPGKTLKAGDTLRIQRGEEEFTVDVMAASGRRGPAAEAQALYREHPDSATRREAEAAARAARRAEQAGRDRRPDKRQRRQIIRFQRDRD